MRNFKKISAIIVAVALVLTSLVPAFAANGPVNGTKAENLNKLEIYKGMSDKTFDPGLALNLTRDQGAMLISRMFGMEEAAAAMSDEQANEILKVFSDASLVPGYAKTTLAYLIQQGVMAGVADTKTGKKYVAAKQNLLGAQFATLILRQMGYTVTEWSTAIDQLSGVDGVTDIDQYISLEKKALIRDNAVGIMYGILSGNYSSGSATVIGKIVEIKPHLKTVAQDLGLIAKETAAALDIKSAVAISSKYVEVTLNTAAAAKDLVLSNISVADAAGKAIAVKSVEFAGWSTELKTILVTLDTNTTVGTLYTVKSGEKSVNFGGKAAETDKPTVSSIVSTDYNQVKVTFSEPVLINGASLVSAEKYADKAALAITNVKYGANNELIFATADQKGATLYGATITGVTDFCGNVMDKDEAKTFVGTAKDATDLKVSAASALNADEVTVQFNVPVNEATINASNFTAVEMYGDKATLAVTSARLAKVDEKAISGATLTDATRKYYVVLTIPGLKDATLYKLTAKGLTSIYDKALSTTEADTYKTFVGKAKPTTVMGFGATPALAISNTEVKVTFDRKIDTATVLAANFAIKEAYGTAAVLNVSAVKVNDDGVSVQLTTGSMKGGMLYKLTVTGLKDIYGNAIKTESSYNTISYAGKGVAEKITKINSIVRNDATTITVAFDQNVGTTATDVAHYTIDNSVGYPEKAEKTTNANEIKLTIPKTTDGKVYKLTVKALENADGVAMASEGVSSNFVGSGVSSTLPTVDWVMASDNQTIKVYFDRDVTDSSVKGVIWNKDTNSLIPNALKLSNNNGTSFTGIAGYAYQDESNKNVLIIRVAAANTFKASSLTNSAATFTLGYAAGIVKNDTNLAIAPNDAAASKPEIIQIAAENSKTLVVYFSEAVSSGSISAGDFEIRTSADTSTATVTAISTVAKIDNRTYKLGLGTALTNSMYYLRVPALSNIKDLSGNIDLKPTTDGGSYVAVQFAGTATDAGKITEVPVTMADDRTIIIWYPEAMNESIVKNKANYSVVDADGVAVAASIAKAEWESATNSVKLTLDATLASSTKGYFLKFATGIMNIAGIKEVQKTDGAQVVTQFAVATNAAPKVFISEAKFTNNGTGVADTLKITFNQEIKTDANLTVGNILNYLNLTVPGTTSGSISGIAAADVDGNAVADTSAAANVKTITITFTADLAAAGNTGEVYIKNSVAAAGFTGINGYNGDVDVKVPFAQ